MLAIYSHINDHAAPFNELISCHPRISIDGGVGNIMHPSTIISSSFHQGVCITYSNAGASPK